MTFHEWWDMNDMDSDPFADYTYGEEVWKEAKRDAWTDVFQILSDSPQLASRELIRKLEEVRESAGYGPKTSTAIPLLQV